MKTIIALLLLVISTSFCFAQSAPSTSAIRDAEGRITRLERQIRDAQGRLQTAKSKEDRRTQENNIRSAEADLTYQQKQLDEAKRRYDNEMKKFLEKKKV